MKSKTKILAGLTAGTAIVTPMAAYTIYHIDDIEYQCALEYEMNEFISYSDSSMIESDLTTEGCPDVDVLCPGTIHMTTTPEDGFICC